MALGCPCPRGQCVETAAPPGSPLEPWVRRVGYGDDGHSVAHGAAFPEPPEVQTPAQSPAPRCRFTSDPSSAGGCRQPGRDLRDPRSLPTLAETP